MKHGRYDVVNNSIVLGTMFCYFPLRGGVRLYSDTRLELQIHFCFIKELGKFLGCNRFLEAGIDHPRKRLIVRNKVAFRQLVS